MESRSLDRPRFPQTRPISLLSVGSPSALKLTLQQLLVLSPTPDLSTIKRLEISNEGIGDIGMDAASALANIKHLSFDHNRLTSLQGLTYCTVLISLSLKVLAVSISRHK